MNLEFNRVAIYRKWITSDRLPFPLGVFRVGWVEQYILKMLPSFQNEVSWKNYIQSLKIDVINIQHPYSILLLRCNVRSTAKTTISVYRKRNILIASVKEVKWFFSTMRRKPGFTTYYAYISDFWSAYSVYIICTDIHHHTNGGSEVTRRGTLKQKVLNTIVEHNWVLHHENFIFVQTNCLLFAAFHRIW